MIEKFKHETRKTRVWERKYGPRFLRDLANWTRGNLQGEYEITFTYAFRGVQPIAFVRFFPLLTEKKKTMRKYSDHKM